MDDLEQIPHRLDMLEHNAKPHDSSVANTRED